MRAPLLLLAAVVALAAAGPLAPTDLRCEYLSNPRGIDMPDPRFSWLTPHLVRAQAQTAYRIQVSLYPAVASGDQWDSGEVASASSSQVAYAGAALVPDQTYYWRAMWWDAEGAPSAWSAVATFDTGLFNDTDWNNAIWITGFNMFRKKFSAPSVVRARAYVAGIGYHELYINGQRIGSNVLDPAWTYYLLDAKYVVHDITKELSSGNNTIGVMLGNGWWGQNFGLKPQLRLLISLRTASGATSYAWSDTTWQGAQSPITMDSIYNGETYDARLEQKDWNKNSFNASSWALASPGTVHPPLSAQLLPPIRTANLIRPVNMTQPVPGTYVFDFGQNFSGWCVLSVKGAKGTTVTMRHAETLYPNGTINVENLRSALATDTYTLKGSSKGETYEPRFTYHGFRFVALNGYPGTPTLKTLYALHVYSSVNTTGSISLHNPILDQIQHNIWWGQSSNLMSVPTDCDQRDERLGWMADGHLSAEEAAHNFDMSAFYTKWVRDMALVQNATTGAMWDVVPPMRYAASAADPAWDAAFPLVASYLLTYYNDTRIVTDLYAQLQSYVAFLAGQAQKTGLTGMYGDFGDWVPPPPQNKASTHFTGSFYYLLAIQTLQNVAAALGNAQESETYAKLFSAVESQFNAAFLKGSTYDIGVQTDMLLPLWLGIVPSSVQAQMETSLINDIVNKNGMHLTTGIIGTKFLPIVLDQIGRTDIAIALALQTTYPSWGYMFTQNVEAEATTLWELWNSPTGSPTMDSRNHIMFGSVGAWFYQSLAGLSQAPASVGYTTLNVTPPSASSLAASPVTHVNGSLNTIRGNFAVAWQLSGAQQCAKAHRGATLRLSCGPNGGVVKRVRFASYGVHAGDCVAPAHTDCHAPASLETVERLCMGRADCEVRATDELFGATPCGDAAKSLFVVAECSGAAGYTLNATIPVGSTSQVRVSKAGMSNVTITEGSITVWEGTFISGDSGVFNATDDIDAIVFQVGSGTYNFTVRGAPSARLCAQAALVRFASLGDGACQPEPRYGKCHVGSSKHVVEKACLGRDACRVPVAPQVRMQKAIDTNSPQHFGDVDCGVKTLAVEAVCAW